MTTDLNDLADLLNRTVHLLGQHAGLVLLEHLETATASDDTATHDQLATVFSCLADQIDDLLVASYCRIGAVRHLLTHAQHEREAESLPPF